MMGRKFYLLILGVLLITITPLQPRTQPLDRNAEFSHNASDDPLDPDFLLPDSGITEFYGSDTNYYYETDESGYYLNVIWVYPVASEDDHDLFLYADSNYTELLAASTHGANTLDWVVFYLNGSIDIHYPRVYAHPSSAGNAFLEWDVGFTDHFPGATITDDLNWSNQMNVHILYCDKIQEYNITLLTPDTGDFDLYLYYLPIGSSTNSSNYLHNHSTRGMGIEEQIANFTPSHTRYYAAVIAWASGNGTYTLEFVRCHTSSSNPIGGLEFVGTLLGVGILTMVAVVLRRRGFKTQILKEVQT
jgi:hypothetical protein